MGCGCGVAKFETNYGNSEKRNITFLDIVSYTTINRSFQFLSLQYKNHNFKVIHGCFCSKVPMFGEIEYDPVRQFSSVPIEEQFDALGKAVDAGK